MMLYRLGDDGTASPSIAVMISNIINYQNFCHAFSGLQFLGEFAKLPRHSSVQRGIRMEQLGPHPTNFPSKLILQDFLKSPEKIKISRKSDKNNGYFT
jgi:hypothetical protein